MRSRGRRGALRRRGRDREFLADQSGRGTHSGCSRNGCSVPLGDAAAVAAETVLTVARARNDGRHTTLRGDAGSTQPMAEFGGGHAPAFAGQAVVTRILRNRPIRVRPQHVRHDTRPFAPPWPGRQQPPRHRLIQNFKSAERRRPRRSPSEWRSAKNSTPAKSRTWNSSRQRRTNIGAGTRIMLRCSNAYSQPTSSRRNTPGGACDHAWKVRGGEAGGP